MKQTLHTYAFIVTATLSASLFGGCGLIAGAASSTTPSSPSSTDSNAQNKPAQTAATTPSSENKPEESDEQKTARLRQKASDASFPEDIYTMYDAKDVRSKADAVLTARGEEKDLGRPAHVALVTKEWSMDNRRQGNRLVQFRWTRATVLWDKEDPRGFCWHDTYDLVEDYDPASKEGWGPMYIGAVCKHPACGNGPIACDAATKPNQAKP